MPGSTLRYSVLWVERIMPRTMLVPVQHQRTAAAVWRL
jgi:hypothetical protein